MFGSKRILPAAMRFVDIAGLVEGASKGEGLGNKFLSHIRQVDAIAQVIRCFEDPNHSCCRFYRSNPRHRDHQY